MSDRSISIRRLTGLGPRRGPSLLSGSARSIAEENSSQRDSSDRSISVAGSHARLGRRRGSSALSQFSSSSIGDSSMPLAPQHQHDEAWTLNKLDLSRLKLYGRSEEVSILRQAYSRVQQTPEQGGVSEMVLVSGLSGAGKSALVEQLRKSVEGTGGFYIKGKFDLNRGDPLTAFITAFTELSDIIVSRSDGDGLLGTVADEMGSDGKVLTDVIPSKSLGEIVGDQADTVKVEGKALRNRQMFAFRRFVRAICSPSHPLVLFLDDLQWADATSLELLQSLITDTDNSSLLIIGTYRDNEVDESHPLTATLGAIEKAKVPMTRIELGNLDHKSVTSLVSDALRMDADLTEPLTNIIYRKTHGNAFFVIQFLNSLYYERLIDYHFGTMRWHWDEKAIEAKFVTDNVVDLICHKIGMASPEAQYVLQIAACLGCEFDTNVLQYVVSAFSKVHGHVLYGVMEENNRKRTLSQILSTCVEDELLEENKKSETYSFPHDQIQSAVYSLIPEAQQGQFQARVGEILIEAVPQNEITNLQFVAVDLCNCGVALIPGGNEKKIRLAEVNFRAGEKAAKSSAFVPAAAYFEVSMKLLSDQNCWESHSNFMLRLYCAAAEAHYCNGNFDEMDIILDQVLCQDLSIDRKLRAYRTRILSLDAQTKFEENIELILSVLGHLGFATFPKSIPTYAVLFDVIKTKLVLKGHTVDTLSNLPDMVDERRIQAMEMMDLLTTPAYQARPQMLPLVSFRMVRWTVKYGVCKCSTIAFLGYSVLMIAGFGDLMGAYDFGQVAAALEKRLNAKEQASRFAYTVHGLINHWTTPLHLSVKPLLQGYHVGMEVGDIESAMWCLQFHCKFLWFTSKSLDSLESLLSMYCGQMEQYNMMPNRALLLVTWQFVHNLQGRTEEPSILSGEVMDCEEVLQSSKETKNASLEVLTMLAQVELYYLFHEYEAAGRMLQMIGEPEKTIPGLYDITRHAILGCLTAIALADRNKSNSSKWIRRARTLSRKVKKWLKAGNSNCLHMDHLIEAEMAALNGKKSLAEKEFSACITTAAKNGFLQDKALAHERAGLFFLREDDTFWASSHFKHAHQSYTDWGAKAKADLIVEVHASLLQ